MPGRHRHDSRVRAVAATAAAAALVVVAAGVWAGTRLVSGERCSGQISLAVAAAPEIAPAVRSVADRWSTTAEVDGKCVVVKVVAQEPAGVAAAVADEQHASLVGLGKANGNARIPQVWVPDSSLWRIRLQAAAPSFQPTGGTSIARSPVVLAMPQPVAAGLGAAASALTWSTLVQQMRQGTQLNAGMVDPTQDTASLAGLLAFGQVTASLGAQADAYTVAVLRTLAKGSSAIREDLLNRFPRALDPDTIASSLTAAVLPEHAVITYNAAKPPIPLAALYVTPAPPPLDYPYLIMPGVTSTVAGAAQQLQAALASTSFRDALAAQGLRGPDGVSGISFASPAGAPPPDTGSPAATAPNLNAVDQTLSAWLALTQPGRILAVIDVSGSMRTPVATAGNHTREQVTIDAAIRGLDLFDDSWALGLWTFSTNLDGPRDYRQIFPISPVSTIRERAVQGLSAIQPKKNGDTGLYDTIDAAFRNVQDNWQAGRLNTVVVLTDGDNDDANGQTLPTLLTTLRKLKDPKRPVDIVIIGIGPDINKGPLQQITSVTGGGVFTAPDPADISTVFLKALALHTPSR